MRPLRVVLWGCALGLVGAFPGPAGAAWDNVFQVCCASCGHGGAVSNYYSGYGGGCCDPCTPPPVCTTRYVQRCYYQPVTCYQTRSYYEPVTAYRTSYYYEPVTTYRYSSYYDPCTGCCQQVACPQTCYQLRSQCCPVQSWVQRCCQVPVTTYQRSFYWEPVTSCCTPSCPSPCQSPCAAPCAGTPGAVAAVPAQPGAEQPPAVTEQRSSPAAPGVQEFSEPNKGSSGSGLYDRYYQAPPTQPSTPMPGAAGTYRQIAPRSPAAVPAPAVRPPAVRLDHIVSLPVTRVEGQVVRNNNLPQAGAKLLFVNAARQGAQQTVTADPSGKFQVTLASGDWLVYLAGADNRPVFHSKIDLRESEFRRVTLVSR